MLIELSHPEITVLATRLVPDFVRNVRQADGVYRFDLALAKVPGGGTKLKLAAALFPSVTLAVRLSVDAEADRRDGVAPRLTCVVTVETPGIPSIEVLKQVRDTVLESLADAGLESAAQVTLEPGEATIVLDSQSVAAGLIPGALVTGLVYTASGLSLATVLV